MKTAAPTGANIALFLAGLMFGLGLAVSGMINPAKVIGFLDLAGAWDPTLILVMGGGLALTLPAFHFILKKPTPLFGQKFHLPTLTQVDGKLLAGASLFGIGWGIAGFCPGPALAALVTLNSSVLLFVAAMLAGMALHRLLLE